MLTSTEMDQAMEMYEDNLQRFRQAFESLNPGAL